MKTTRINYIDLYIQKEKEKTRNYFIGFTLAVPSIVAVVFAVIDRIAV